MACSCGKDTETRIGMLGIGYIHGCWDDSHKENLDITDECFNVIEAIYDIVPRCGDECTTIENAIDSWKEWDMFFNENNA